MPAAHRFSWMLILLAAALSAKGDEPRAPSQTDAKVHTVRVDVNLVTIGVRVSDRKGREVSGLKQEEFSVFEDGKQQPIAVFASEQQPVSVLMLLDRSYSMGQGGKLEQAKLALQHLLENSHPDSEYALVVFDDEPVPLLDFSSDRQKIEAALGRTSSHRSGSSLYDSMAVALDRFDRARYPRHVLVVITDGADQHSRLQLHDVLGAVQRSRSQVYLVGFFDPKEDAVFRDSGKTVTLVSGKEIDNPRHAFKRLAEESGAERYFPESGEELGTVVRTIAQDQRTQYTLGYYYTSDAYQEERYRRIEVKVRPKGLRVRARHGFLSSGNDERELPMSAVPVRPPASAETIQQRSLPYEIKTERHGKQVIFREDFSDAASGWPQKPGFFLKEGQYHLKQLRPKALNEGHVAANGPWWTDFEASVLVEFQPGPDVYSIPPAAGLVFRINERGYYALVISRPAGFAKVYYKLVKKFHLAAAHDLLFWEQELLSRPESGKPFQHKLGVICRGNLIQLNVNGVRVRELHDDSFSDGLAGVMLFGVGHAVFDDLVAQSIVE
jgi:Ca-activated chloride channel homolog